MNQEFEIPLLRMCKASVLFVLIFALTGAPVCAEGLYADIISTNENIGTVSVLVNNHDNSFVKKSPDPDAGSHPNYVTADDINEDGIADLVIVNGMSGGERVLSFLAGQGQGEFEPRTTYSLGYEAANSLAMGDFNKDGHQDILVPNWYPGGQVQILTGNGSGQFMLSASRQVEGRANAVSTGDYNQDGNLDGVVCNWDHSKITILYGNGNGGFFSDRQIAAGMRPQSVGTADFDHDGDDDLVVACALSPAVTVFWNNGDDTLTRQELNLDTDLGGAGIVRIGDFNNDNNRDLLTFVRQSGQWFLSVFLWNAGSRLFDEPHINTPIEYLTGMPNAMETADFNGDGITDVVLGDLGNQKVSVYLGNNDGTFDPSSQISAALDGTPVGLAVLDLNIEPPFPDLRDGLILEYTFSEDHGGVVMDESGNGYHGTVQGASFTGAGRFGGAYHFDGMNDVILVNDDLGFQPEGTIAFWMKADAVENWRNPFSTDYAGWDDNIRFEETANGVFTAGALGLSTVTPFPDGVYEETYTHSLQADRWYHVVYAWDEARDYGYLDGELVFSTFHPPADARVHPNLPLTAGQYRELTLDFNRVAVGNGYSQSSDRYWKGFVDEVYIYNRVLSSQEVAALYDGLSQGILYQDFEPDNGSDPYGWGINGALVSLDPGPAPSESQVWKVEIPSGRQWGGTAVASQIQGWDLDFRPGVNDRFSFWIWASPLGGASVIAPVEVKFFDWAGNIFIVDTAEYPEFEEWTKLEILFSQFPGEFKLDHIDKIELIYPQEGIYYFDHLHVTLGDRVYQAFEPWRCPPQDPGRCGWAWNGAVSIETQDVLQGEQSWKLTAVNNPLAEPYDPAHPDSYRFQQAGTGIQAQRDIWHYSLSPSHLDPRRHDRLTFWVRQLADNGMNNNIFVKFFDHGNYHTVPAQFWTEKNAEYDNWTRLSLPLNRLPQDFNLDDIDKIEFEVFWPGEYYFDDIRAAKMPELVIDQAALPDGTVSWNSYLAGVQYTLQKSSFGPQGPWETIYSGQETDIALEELEMCWLRVRWGIPGDSGGDILVESDWSDAVPYFAKPVLIRHARLQQGFLEWSAQPLGSSYIVEEAFGSSGQWTQIYSGPQTTLALSGADIGKYYRVRAVGNVDSGQWSPALAYDPEGFIKTAGTNLRAEKGAGDLVQLKGVNLGNYLLLEPWMLGDGPEFHKRLGEAGGKYFDDWTIREYLGSEAQDILNVYQDAYIQEIDFDHIMRMGFNYVRLPLYYRNICDLNEQGDWTCGGNFNFDKIDEVVNACADRGIFVLLDLHGAPGGQSPEFHTGRTTGAGYMHQLFDPQITTYRQRTLELWNAIALRYKDNTAVVGYDLLNEPTGFEDYPGGVTLLHDFYDDMYQEIRTAAGDEHHVIVMEGAWDWDSLPRPSDKGWENVMYQFHYYCWEPEDGNPPVLGETCPGYDKKYLEFIPGMTLDDVITYHQAFIDRKVSDSHQFQDDYNVPVLIGEFNGFGISDVWEYYLSRFNAEGWNWSLWSYKTHGYPSSWGLYNHFLYDETLPDFDQDSRADLERKFSKYDTAGHHVPNMSLIRTVTDHLDRIDYDGDGLSDAVDTQVTVSSHDFDDHSAPSSYGTIINRRDHILAVMDDPDPENGVRIIADESGGIIPAEIQVCSSARRVFMFPGDDVVVTCTPSGERVRRDVPLRRRLWLLLRRYYQQYRQ